MSSRTLFAPPATLLMLHGVSTVPFSKGVTSNYYMTAHQNSFRVTAYPFGFPPERATLRLDPVRFANPLSNGFADWIIG